MQNSPYSIYIDKRPIRIAFLVPINNVELVDKIIEFNLKKWGGRYNIIIPTDGNEIDPIDWNLLKSFDPDSSRGFIRKRL